MIICSHCLQPMRGFAAVNDDYLCHPDEGLDCYHMVTVWAHPMPCATCRALPAILRAIAQAIEPTNRPDTRPGCDVTEQE